MTIFIAILRALGIPLCIFLFMLGYYEGVPVLRDIPFVDQIPVVRELIAGRVPTERVRAADAARSGYVLEAEKKAAEARAAKMEKDRAAAQKVIDAYQVQLMNRQTLDALENEQHEQEIADCEKKLSAAGRACHVTDADRGFLLDPLQDRLDKAATTQGELQAGLNLPDLPPACRVMEPHAPVIVGGEAISGWKRERTATDRANARVGRCAGFYNSATGKTR